jgi:hypothetical protein
MKGESINIRKAENLLHIEVVTVNWMITFIIQAMIRGKFMFLKPNKKQRRIHFTQHFFQIV